MCRRETEPRHRAVVEDLLAVVLHGRELGPVEAIEAPMCVGLLIRNLGDPRPPPPLLDTKVGLRWLPGPGEDGEVLEIH